MKAQEFIAIARRLAAGPLDAATCRTITSRAYYGAFLMARAFLNDIGHSPGKRDNSHVLTQRYLAECGDANARAASSRLSDLHRKRLHADYDLQDARPEQASEAKASLVDAGQVEQLLQLCSAPPVKAQIAAGIAAYLAKIRRL